MKKLVALIFTLILIGTSLYSQIGMYPQVVFLDMQNRSSLLRIMNSSNDTKEITIELKFGYPKYDSLGKIVTAMGDSLPEAKYSAVPFVKVFPKKLLLKGKEEQVIKFMLGNVSDITDGTYYGRIFILSKNPTKTIDTNTSENISAKIDFQFTLVSALIVGKGKRDCLLKVTEAKATVDSALVNLLVGFERAGNSPFFGTAEVNISNMKGDKIVEKKEVTPIYFTSKKAFQFDKSLFRNGKYKVDIIMTNEHRDVPNEFKVPFEPVKASFVIDLENL